MITIVGVTPTVAAATKHALVTRQDEDAAEYGDTQDREAELFTPLGL